MVKVGVASDLWCRRMSAIERAAILRVACTGAIVALVGGVVLPVGGFSLTGCPDLRRRRWIAACVPEFILSMAFGAMAGRRPKRTPELAIRSASGGGRSVNQMRAMLTDFDALFANYLSAALALVVLVLMVLQPIF